MAENTSQEIDKIRKYDHWYYRSYCSICNADRGCQRKHKMQGVCASCSAKHKIAKFGNPMSGKKHSNREKFRKRTHENVDYDSLIVTVSKSGNKIKRYRQYCPICKADVGYRQAQNAKRMCIKCRADGNRKYSEIQRKIRASIKANVNSRIKSRSIEKDFGVSKILPFSLHDLFDAIEAKFKPGMSWENYGEWELDHITPDSWFKYESVHDEEFKKSWSIDNFQPLWKKENASKSNRYAGEYQPNYKRGSK